MNRRRFLAGVALSVSLGGCLADPGDPENDSTENDSTEPDGDGSTDSTDGDEDSVPVLTGYAVSDHVVTPDAERFSDMDSWGLFLATREVAEEYFGDVDEDGAEGVREFVDESEFQDGDRLLYVHAYAPQTCYELALDGEPRVAENGLPLVETVVDRTEPEDEPCGDAVTSVRLLVRLSFDLDGGSPDVVEVHVSGHRDIPEELLVEAER